MRIIRLGTKGMAAPLCWLLLCVPGLAVLGVRAGNPDHLALQRLEYAAEMNLAQLAWEQTNFARLERALASTANYPERGFEWHYWQRNLRQAVTTLEGHEGWVTTLAYSPDGTTLASGSTDHTARLWDLEQRQVRFTLRGHGGNVWALAFSADGTRMVTTGDDCRAIIWDVASGRPAREIPGPSSDDWLDRGPFRQRLSRPRRHCIRGPC